MSEIKRDFLFFFFFSETVLSYEDAGRALVSFSSSYFGISSST